MHKAKLSVSLFLTVFILLVGGFIAIYATWNKLQAPETSALYGGDPEAGYPSAGYLINRTTGGGLKTCGFSMLTSTIGITAGHCVDEAQVIYVGKGEFDFNNVTAQSKISKAITKQGWAESQQRTADFSILHLEKNNLFTDFGRIGSPTESCDYRVVAYGRTEDPNQLGKPRKSAQLCVSSIGPDTFQVKGYSSGICYGDSGSPIYREGTNQIIGIVVSIIKQDPNENAACAFGNTAIAVRVDANQRLITNEVQASGITSPQQVDEITTISVAEETVWEKIGLSQIQNLTEREKQIYLLVGLFIGVAVLIVSIILMLLRKPSEEVPVYNPYHYGW